MRAAVLREGRLVVDEIPEPPAPREGQVVVEVLANGICGTDLHLTSDLDGWFEATERAGDTIKLFDRSRDTVLGHEFAGRVIELGEGVTRVSVGDLVYCVPIAFNSAGSMKCLGFSDEYPGGLGQRATVEAFAVVKLPEGLDPVTATFLDSMTVGEYAVVDRTKVESGRAAVVIGTGPIGLGVIAALRRAGASPVFAVEPCATRAAAAQKIGADVVVDPNVGSWKGAWEEAGIEGPAYVFETSGVRGMIPRLFEEVPVGSTITSVASGTQDEPIRPSIGVKKDISLLFSMGGSVEHYERMAKLLADKNPDLGEFVTGIGLDQVADAFEALHNPDAHIKVAVLPQEL